MNKVAIKYIFFHDNIPNQDIERLAKLNPSQFLMRNIAINFSGGLKVSFGGGRGGGK